MLISARDDIEVVHCTDQESPNEDCFVEVRLWHGSNLVLGCLFCPPFNNKSSINNFVSNLSASLDCVSAISSNIVIVGDLNAKNEV